MLGAAARSAAGNRHARRQALQDFQELRAKAGEKTQVSEGEQKLLWLAAFNAGIIRPHDGLDVIRPMVDQSRAAHVREQLSANLEGPMKQALARNDIDGLERLGAEELKQAATMIALGRFDPEVADQLVRAAKENDPGLDETRFRSNLETAAETVKVAQEAERLAMARRRQDVLDTLPPESHGLFASLPDQHLREVSHLLEQESKGTPEQREALFRAAQEHDHTIDRTSFDAMIDGAVAKAKQQHAAQRQARQRRLVDMPEDIRSPLSALPDSSLGELRILMATADSIPDATRQRMIDSALRQHADVDPLAVAAALDQAMQTARPMRAVSDSEDAQLRPFLLDAVPSDQRTSLADVPIVRVPADEFAAFTQSETGQAVTLIINGRPVVVIKEGADPSVLREEGIHALQAKDPKWSKKVGSLDESKLRRWDDLPVDEQLTLYRNKLDLEIDAQQRLIANLDSQLSGDIAPDARADLRNQIERARLSLDNLQNRQSEVTGLSGGDLDAMRAGLRSPDWLSQPSRLFAKDADAGRRLADADSFDRDGLIQNLGDLVPRGRKTIARDLASRLGTDTLRAFLDTPMHRDDRLELLRIAAGTNDPDGAIRTFVILASRLDEIGPQRRSNGSVVDSEFADLPDRRPKYQQRGDPRDPGRSQFSSRDAKTRIQDDLRSKAREAFGAELQAALHDPSLHNLRTFFSMSFMSEAQIDFVRETGRLPGRPPRGDIDLDNFGKRLQAALANPVEHNVLTWAAMRRMSQAELEHVRTTGRLPDGISEGALRDIPLPGPLELHHMMAVADFPEFAHMGEAGVALPPREHKEMGHGGDTTRPLEAATLIDPGAETRPAFHPDPQSVKHHRWTNADIAVGRGWSGDDLSDAIVGARAEVQRLERSAERRQQRGQPADAGLDSRIDRLRRGLVELEILAAHHHAVSDGIPTPKSGSTQEALRNAMLDSVPQSERHRLADVPILVVRPEEFAAFTKSDSGQAVTVIHSGHPVIVIRSDAGMTALREEGIHALQARDPAWAARVGMLDEQNVANWHRLSLDEQLALYRNKMEIEIDAQERMLLDLHPRIDAADPAEAARLQQEARQINESLGNLQNRLAEVDGITPKQRVEMQAGREARPDWLDQPARLFSKSSPPHESTTGSKSAEGSNQTTGKPLRTMSTTAENRQAIRDPAAVKPSWLNQPSRLFSDEPVTVAGARPALPELASRVRQGEDFGTIVAELGGWQHVRSLMSSGSGSQADQQRFQNAAWQWQSSELTRIVRSPRSDDAEASRVLRQFGGWKAISLDTVRAQRGGNPATKKLAARAAADVQSWRLRVFDRELDVAIRKFSASESLAVPVMKRTGTDSVLSDVDVSFLGPDATRHRNAAIHDLLRRFGDDFGQLLYADVFSDPTRLHLSDSLQDQQRGELETHMMRETGENVLAKLLRLGMSERDVRRYVQVMFPDSDEHMVLMQVRTRRAELDSFANQDTRRQRELELDRLHHEFLRTNDPLRRAVIARKMAETQSRLNASMEGPYLSPGGAKRHVTRRDDLTGERRGGQFEAMSSRMRYLALLDDLAMLEQVNQDIQSKGWNAKNAKSWLKYAGRLLISAGQTGVDMSRIDGLHGSARQLADDVSFMLRGARRLPPEQISRLDQLQQLKTQFDASIHNIITFTRYHVVEGRTLHGTPSFLRELHAQQLADFNTGVVRPGQVRPTDSLPTEPGPAGRFEADQFAAAYSRYDQMLSAAPGHEVGIYRNIQTGEYAVELGTAHGVQRPTTPEGVWETVLHFHPNPGNLMTFRRPSPADVEAATKQASRAETTVPEFLEFPTGPGERGRVRYEVDPNTHRVAVERRVGERTFREEFPGMHAYERDYFSRTFMLDPESPEYAWVMLDIQRRLGHSSESTSGQTMAGSLSQHSTVHQITSREAHPSAEQLRKAYDDDGLRDLLRKQFLDSMLDDFLSRLDAADEKLQGRNEETEFLRSISWLLHDEYGAFLNVESHQFDQLLELLCLTCHHVIRCSN